MNLGFPQRDDETCYDAMIRQAQRFGKERQCAKVYQDQIAEGASEYMAAFHALYEFDLLETLDDD